MGVVFIYDAVHQIDGRKVDKKINKKDNIGLHNILLWKVFIVNLGILACRPFSLKQEARQPH